MFNILWGLLQFIWVWAFGALLLRSLPVFIPKSYRLAVAFLLGETVISYFLLVMGLLGCLKPSVILPVVSITALISASALLNELKPAVRRLPRLVRLSPVAAILVGLFLLTYMVAACVPEREVDSLWYHLFVPQFYLNHGGQIQEVPFNLPSHYPMNAHLHYAVTLMLGNDTSAKFFTLFHFVPLLIGLAGAAKRYAGKQWMLPVCVVLLACVHYKLPVMVNVYRPLQLSLLLSTLLLLYHFESGRKAPFYLAALFCGMALGTKFTAIFFVFGAQIVFMILRWALQKRTHTLSRLKAITIYSLIAWAMASPWLVKSYIYTGNPFFPALSGVFNTKPHYQAVAETYANVHGLAPFKAHTIMEWGQMVWNNIQWAIFNTDVLFSMGVVALLFMLFIRSKRGFNPALAALCVYLFFPLLWGHAVVRLFSASYPIVALAIIVFLHGLTQRAKQREFMVNAILIALVASFAMNKSAYFSSPNLKWRGEIRLSEPARRQWLSERNIMPQHLFDMKDWMDVRLRNEAKIYSFNSEYPYYLDQKIYFSDELFGEQLHLWLETGPEEAASQLRRLGVEWFLDGGKHYDRPPKHLKSDWDRFRFIHLREEHREGDAVLYRFD
ncbi:MAG: hypothetical protein P9L94_15895 [Candidatus Hinthialibacter antarcticus]|nr:hypothetical protein [Candidatus Hinthialibacter antarcticus]